MSTNPTHSFIDHLPLLADLKHEEKEQLKKASDYRVAKRYGQIYMQDEPVHHLYFLIKGSVKIGTHSEDGKEIIKKIIHPGAIFGEMGVIGEARRKDFAQAMKKEVHYMAIRLDVFKNVMQQNFNLTKMVISLIGDRLKSAEDRLESMIFKDARARIIDFLRKNAERRGKQIGYETLIKHSLTQQDIANLTGTSRQTVTSVLNELKKDNQIYFNRRSILIRNLSTLA